MKSAVFREYIIRIKISKVIFKLKDMKMFFFYFLYYYIGNDHEIDGVRIEKKKKKKRPRTYTYRLHTIWIPSLKCFFVILDVEKKQ